MKGNVLVTTMLFVTTVTVCVALPAPAAAEGPSAAQLRGAAKDYDMDVVNAVRAQVAQNNVTGSNQLWFRSFDAQLGLLRCGEIDASPYVPTELFEPRHFLNLVAYADVTVRFYKTPVQNTAVELGRCSAAGYTVCGSRMQGIEWTPGALMGPVCGERCGCNFQGACSAAGNFPGIRSCSQLPSCRDVLADDPAAVTREFCSLCRPSTACPGCISNTVTIGLCYPPLVIPIPTPPSPPPPLPPPAPECLAKPGQEARYLALCMGETTQEGCKNLLQQRNGTLSASSDESTDDPCEWGAPVCEAKFQYRRERHTRDMCEAIQSQSECSSELADQCDWGGWLPPLVSPPPPPPRPTSPRGSSAGSAVMHTLMTLCIVTLLLAAVVAGYRTVSKSKAEKRPAAAVFASDFLLDLAPDTAAGEEFSTAKKMRVRERGGSQVAERVLTDDTVPARSSPPTPPLRAFSQPPTPPLPPWPSPPRPITSIWIADQSPFVVEPTQTQATQPTQPRLTRPFAPSTFSADIMGGSVSIDELASVDDGNDAPMMDGGGTVFGQPFVSEAGGDDLDPGLDYWDIQADLAGSVELPQFSEEEFRRDLLVIPRGPTSPTQQRPARNTPPAGGETVYRCPHEGCDYSSVNLRYMKTHQRRHLGQKPHICTYPGCTYSALSTGTIKRHMVTHTKEKQFKCNWVGCTKSYTQSAHLQTHMLVHTGQKPYKCPVPGCSYCSSRKSDVTRHQKQHDRQMQPQLKQEIE